MDLHPVSPNSEKFIDYLLQKTNYPADNRSFRFIAIHSEEDEDGRRTLDFIGEMIPETILIKMDSDFIMIYFSEEELDLKSMVLSISDDFGISVRVFAGGKVDCTHPEYLFTKYLFYKKYLDSSDYAGVADLILEIIRKDINSLRKIKAAVLNDVYEDSQMEKLILSMFENNLNVTRTASDIYMHRNTVINKLEYIRQETGLNLQHFRDAICMYWLIRS